MVHKHVFGKLRCKLINKKITYHIYRYLIIKDLWCHVTVMFSGSNDLDSRPFSERRVEEMRRPQRSDNENKHWQPRWQDLTGHDTSKMLAMYFPHKISQNKVLKKYPCKTCGTLIDVNNPNRRCDTTWYDLFIFFLGAQGMDRSARCCGLCSDQRMLVQPRNKSHPKRPT